MQLKWTNSSICYDTDKFNNIMNDEAQRNTWFMILLFKTKTHTHKKNKIKE